MGSGNSGTGHWWAQRITAVALLLLGPWFLVSLLRLDDLQFAAVSAWMGLPWNSTLLFMLFATLAYHSKLGVQVVIEDYVHGPDIKPFSLLLNGLAHVLLAAAGLFAVLKIGLGAA
jgi:succinate dehydrogenase membrane anchor subunit